MSQTPLEQAHIVEAFCFELSKLTVPAIRERMVASLRNVSDDLADKVAEGLGISPLPPAMPRALAKPQPPEVKSSPSLSLTARPGDGSIMGLKVALLVAHGVNGKSVLQVQTALADLGAIGKIVGPRIGLISTDDGGIVHAQASLDNEPGFLFDALVLPSGQLAITELAAHRQTINFIKDQYFHCKTMLMLPGSIELLNLSGCAAKLADSKSDPGLVVAANTKVAAAIDTFLQALALQRHPEREHNF